MYYDIKYRNHKKGFKMCYWLKDLNKWSNTISVTLVEGKQYSGSDIAKLVQYYIDEYFRIAKNSVVEITPL